jgi:hypothetical protein
MRASLATRFYRTNNVGQVIATIARWLGAKERSVWLLVAFFVGRAEGR